jgi:hypothetical protein
MEHSIQAGISGALIAITINLFSPVYLDFIPSFVAVILAIYLYRLGAFKDGLLVAFMTYLFNEAVLNAIIAATYYLTEEPYTLTVDIWIVLSPIVTSISALIAGYVGVLLVQKMKPAKELAPSLPQQLPPV